MSDVSTSVGSQEDAPQWNPLVQNLLEGISDLKPKDAVRDAAAKLLQAAKIGVTSDKAHSYLDESVTDKVKVNIKITDSVGIQVDVANGAAQEGKEKIDLRPAQAARGAMDEWLPRAVVALYPLDNPGVQTKLAEFLLAVTTVGFKGELENLLSFDTRQKARIEVEHAARQLEAEAKMAGKASPDEAASYTDVDRDGCVSGVKGELRDKIMAKVGSPQGTLKGPVGTASDRLGHWALLAVKTKYKLSDEKVQVKFAEFLLMVSTYDFEGKDTTGTTMGNFQGKWVGFGEIKTDESKKKTDELKKKTSQPKTTQPNKW